MSIDDFYLTNSQQKNLHNQYPSNKLLEFRGNPGTHDINLLYEILSNLLSNEIPLSIPQYDKSLCNGYGDRSPYDQWKVLTQSVDIILLEGWMLGFQSINELEIINEDMKQVNEFLQNYQQIYNLIDSWLLLHVKDISIVFQWRLEAEHVMKRNGKSCLSDEQVHDFVSRFVPAYEVYLPNLYQFIVSNQSKDNLIFHIDKDRLPILEVL